VFRQGIPIINLFIEKETDKVPSDGKYHLIQNGTILASSRSLKIIQKKYNEIVAALPAQEKNDNPSTNEPKDEKLKELILKDIESRYVWIGEQKKPRKRPSCRTFR